MAVLQVVSQIAQIASPILYAVFIVLIYFQLRSARDSVQEVRQEFLAGGRPVVAVHDEYDPVTGDISLVVENVGQGPAKDVNFSFAQPLETSDGVVISDLPLFTVGLTSLSPAARITCHWDDFEDLMVHLAAQDRGGTDFAVSVQYSDLTGAVYTNDWDIQPSIYQGLRSPPRQEAAEPTGPAERSDLGTGPGTETPTTAASPATETSSS